MEENFNETVKLNLYDLPYDILLNIFNNLSYKEIIYLSQVNKKLHLIANDDLLWKIKLIKDINKWKVCCSYTYPKELFINDNGSSLPTTSNSDDVSYKNVYLKCCPDILTKKEILKNLQIFQEVQNKLQLTSTSESLSFSSNKDYSNANSVTLSSLSSLSMPFVVFGQLKDYIYRNVFNYSGMNENSRVLNDCNEAIPKLILFGPGLETTTSCLVTNILWKSEFKTIGMIPGKDGYGSGIKLKLFNHKPFNLTILYTNVSKVRNNNSNHELQSNRLLVGTNNPDSNDVSYELQSQVKEACSNASGFVYVIDNKHLSSVDGQSEDKNTTENYKLELNVLMREANRDLPLLVLSCGTNENGNDVNNQTNKNNSNIKNNIKNNGKKENSKLSCSQLVNKLQLCDLNCEWQIRDCEIFQNKMKDIILGFEWILNRVESDFLKKQTEYL